MKNLSLLLLAGLLVPCLATAAPTQNKAPDGPPNAKAEIDADGNGMVSKAEFLAYQEKRFAEADANKDGNITDEEHKASMEKWKAKRQELRAKMKDAAPAKTAAQPATGTP